MSNTTRTSLSPIIHVVLTASCSSLALSAELALNPATMPTISQVDQRFQAYNVEMLEVTGGRFWKPYKDLAASSTPKPDSDRPGSTPTGMSASLYQYRAPIDLGNTRLRKLAAALGPAYMRVSGT